MKIIAPSMLSSDFGRLIDEIELINKSNADWFHLDVMDGVFVPNITFGPPVLDIFKNYANFRRHLHIFAKFSEISEKIRKFTENLQNFTKFKRILKISDA